jgi:hypothetical protein
MTQTIPSPHWGEGGERPDEVLPQKSTNAAKSFFTEGHKGNKDWKTPSFSSFASVDLPDPKSETPDPNQG